MDRASKLVLKRRVHRSLPSHTIVAIESCADDSHAKMALPAIGSARMPLVQVALVHNIELLWRKGSRQFLLNRFRNNAHNHHP